MRTKKRLLAAAAGAGIAPLLALFLATESATGHGWVNSPPSRQDQCAQGIVPCGDIKWEPQSVEAPKGSLQCNGGNPRFAELDDDSKGWRVTNVGRTATFTWRLTARHRTSTWQYYIGSTKIAEFDDGGAQPPETVSHTVDFGSRTGYQKVLAVWNVFDTGNAFYACVDVNVGGGSTTGGTTTGGTTTGGTTTGGTSTGGGGGQCATPAWSRSAVYTAGNVVSHNGRDWQAKWWTQGEEPGTTGEWGVWQDLGAC